ncbi:MAG TPA: hypothetical protein VK154_08405 [Chitinophagales bacterium]|nr:hypothetical protein [Chitinophagales bacterium]
MNLLFDFLKHLQPDEKKKLLSLQLKGRSAEVWDMINRQAEKQLFEREKIETALGISSAHFDKITSQLLARCYEQIFGSDGLQLLDFLSDRAAFVKHYYQEMKRQMNHIEKTGTKKQQAEFYKANINYIHYNMPIIHKDEVVIGTLADKYIAIEKNRNAKMLVECKQLYVQIDKLFAAALIRSVSDEQRKKIEAMGPLPEDADEELAFAYYWLRIYFNNAIEDFAQSFKVTREALQVLSRYKSAQNTRQMLRIELKQAELLYYLSRFEESFQYFKKHIYTVQTEHLPDSSFYYTKYIQICLITGNIDEAGKIITGKNMVPREHMRELILPREIISLAKFHLFNGDYDQAFEFIQLGFEKNPKGKYFQYEVELRNMQTAYFYLTNQKRLAVQMCNKHIKYLRSHGYGIRVSDFPYFYVLTKAMYEKKKKGKPLSAKEQTMLQRYQLGSYAVYGKLLLKMLEA